jgi:hypothetical protein
MATAEAVLSRGAVVETRAAIVRLGHVEAHVVDAAWRGRWRGRGRRRCGWRRRRRGSWRGSRHQRLRAVLHSTRPAQAPIRKLLVVRHEAAAARRWRADGRGAMGRGRGAWRRRGARRRITMKEASFDANVDERANGDGVCWVVVIRVLVQCDVRVFAVAPAAEVRVLARPDPHAESARVCVAFGRALHDRDGRGAWEVVQAPSRAAHEDAWRIASTAGNRG